MWLAAGQRAVHTGASPYGDLDAAGTAWEIRVEVVGGGLRFGGVHAGFHLWRLWVKAEIGRRGGGEREGGGG